MSYQLCEREYRADVAKEKEIAEASGQEYKAPKQPTSTTRITDREDAEIEIAKEIGREKANSSAVLEKLRHYVK